MKNQNIVSHWRENGIFGKGTCIFDPALGTNMMELVKFKTISFRTLSTNVF